MGHGQSILPVTCWHVRDCSEAIRRMALAAVAKAPPERAFGDILEDPQSENVRRAKKSNRALSLTLDSLRYVGGKATVRTT